MNISAANYYQRRPSIAEIPNKPIAEHFITGPPILPATCFSIREPSRLNTVVA
jgi:hypothetical protein